jgi:hypothetical protein
MENPRICAVGVEIWRIGRLAREFVADSTRFVDAPQFFSAPQAELTADRDQKTHSLALR